MGSGYARAGCWGARNTRAGAEATHKTAETQGEKREAQQKKGGGGEAIQMTRVRIEPRF